VGQEFGGFLGLRERSSSYINTRGAACSSQDEFFFKAPLFSKVREFQKSEIQLSDEIKVFLLAWCVRIQFIILVYFSTILS